MKNKPFIKTYHFLYRQWYRGVNEKILTKIVQAIQEVRKGVGKAEVIVTPSFLNQIGFKSKRCLVLILKGKVLITCYWKEFSELFFGKTKFQNPIIL